MTTMEKLFAEIFIIKDQIIEQVQQEADSYTKQLASKLLINGVTPPTWLLSPNYNFQSSNPNDLKREAIISKLLLRPQRQPVSYSRGDCALYYRPVDAGGNGHLSNTCVENDALNKGIDVSNGPMTTNECYNNDTVCTVNPAVELDDNVKSPQNETDARISSIYAEPGSSLVRIQRSKSRQKAWKLRTKGKTASKSCLSNENKNHISFSGDPISKSDFHQVTQDKCPSEVRKCNDISGETYMAAELKAVKGNDRSSHSGRVANSSSSYDKPSFLIDHSKNNSSSEKKELDGGVLVQPSDSSLQQYDHVNSVIQGGKLPDVFLGSYAGKKSINKKSQDTQSQNKFFCGRITRSRCSSQQVSGINRSLKLGKSASCNPKEDGGALSQSVGNLIHGLNAFNKLLDSVETSQVRRDRIGDAQALCSNEDILNPVISSKSNIADPRVTRSSSGSMQESLFGANHEESAEIIVVNMPTEAPVEIQAVNSGIRLDPITLCTESEGLILRQSPEYCTIFKPKQLNFDENNECYLNEISSPLSKKRKLHGLSGLEYYPLKESASSIDRKSSSTFSEQQFPKENVWSNSPKAAKTHSHKKNDECAEDEMMSINLDVTKNSVLEDVELNPKVSQHDDTEVTCEGDIGHRDEESAATVYIPISENNSSLTKQANKDTEEIPLGSSKLRELEMGTNPKLSNAKLSSAQADLGHKDEERAADVYEPIYKNTNSSFLSSLTKQGNDVAEQDFGSPKSNQFEIEMKQKLSNVKLSSAKVNTWPCYQQRNAEEPPNCFSDSQNFKVHIHRDAIRCDLKASGSGLHSVKESASILPSEETHVARLDDTTMCDLPEQKESLLELQAAEAVVTQVDDDTPEMYDAFKQSEPIFISNSADDYAYSLSAEVGPTNPIINDDITVSDNNSFEINLPEWVCSYGSARSSRNDDKTDEILPVYDGLIIDEEVENAGIENAEGGIGFDTLEIQNATIARASILDQICKSSSMQTPLSEFSSKFKQHQIQDYFGFMTDLGTTVDIRASESNITEIDYAFPVQQRFDYATPFYWESKNRYSSPVGKLWERSASSSGSSEKKFSSNPELNCFPIKEDPCCDEERENAEEMSGELQENITSKVENENLFRVSTEMKIDEVFETESPPESTEVCSQHENHESNFMKYQDRNSSTSVNVEVNVPRTRDKVKHTPRIHRGIKINRYNENRNSSMATRASSRGNLSEYGKNKSNMRSGMTRLSQKEAKCNNIVSNISSFIPMVQQKQAAAVCPGKRDIKVKALEAAEAARRRAEEKENERKMKKEALKLERARIGKENAREMELNKKKKQEELKKKEADIAARKRQREEDEKKQVAKKRKLVVEAHKNQKLQYEKSRAGKVESEIHVKNAAIAGNKKEFENQIQNKNAIKNSLQKQDSNSAVVRQFISVLENHDASSDCSEKEKATCIDEKSPVKFGPVMLTSPENSYDLSPYTCSDDEDDEEDTKKSDKFIPSWASVNRVAMVVPFQQNLDPASIFPVDSFCNMDEVLLPRRLHAQ